MIASDSGSTAGEYPVYGYPYSVCMGQDTNIIPFGSDEIEIVTFTDTTLVCTPTDYWDEFYSCPHCDDYLWGQEVCFKCCEYFNPSRIIFHPKEKVLFSRKQIGIRHNRRSGNKNHDRFPKERFT